MFKKILKSTFNNKLKLKSKHIEFIKTMTTKSGEAISKLRDFGYAFNAGGELRKIDETTGEPGEEPFVFEISKDHATNQLHYEKLADQIPEIIYDLLEQNGLTRTYIPIDSPHEKCTFIFTQPQNLQKSKKLLVLIHGSGYVRAGQWARSLIINNSLDHGTQLPYIKKAQELGYDILITNTNDNTRLIDGKLQKIPGLGSASAHANYVWENFVMPSEPESVAIVAHSYGGAITLELAHRYPEFFRDKVFGIALTDSAHGRIPDAAKNIVSQIACNWASSSSPLDVKLSMSDTMLPCVSAGHPKHEWSSFAAFKSVFKFLEEKYKAFEETNTKSKKPKMNL